MLAITELFTFLQKLDGMPQTVQMVCSWTGSPPPVIAIDAEAQVGLNGRFELSTELSVALMKDVQASRSAAEVSNGGLTV